MVTDKVQMWWRTRTPEQKRNYKLGAIIASVIAAVTVGTMLAPKSMNGNQNNKLKEAEKVNSTTFIEKPGKMSRQELTSEFEGLKKQVSTMQELLEKQNGLTSAQLDTLSSKVSKQVLQAEQGKKVSNTANPIQSANNRQLQSLEDQINELRAQLNENQTPRFTAPQSKPFFGAPGISVLGGANQMPSEGVSGTPAAAQGAGVPNAPTPPKKLESVGINPRIKNVKQMGKVVKVSGTNTAYIPAGTIITGVLLNGMQASTGPSARANPEITDIRVKMNAILPNRLRQNYRNCMIIASGYGDLASRRVYLRTNTLSCVAPGGGVISAPIHGYIVGSDGLVGVRGTVISHQSSVLVKSLIAGIFSGLGSAVHPNQVNGLTLNPLSGGQQTYQLPSPGYIGGEAFSGGVSTAAGNISKFYLHEAESLLPTIQINPGVSVDIVLEKGSVIHLKGDTKSQLAEATYSEQSQPTPTYSGQSPAVAAAFPQQGGYPGYPAPQTPTAQMRQQYAVPQNEEGYP